MSNRKIKIAVIVGEHPYDVQEFQHVFTDNNDLEAYIQSLEMFTTSPKEVRDSYEVLVFYHMYTKTPSSENNGTGVQRNALELLGDTRQGILILHHSLLAFPDWKLWADIVGIKDRKFDYHYNQVVDYKIEKNHPITENVKDFTLTDETYSVNEPGDECEVLVTTNHKPSMKSILWVKSYKNAPVVCYESGHDALAFKNENFRKLLYNSILWLADKHHKE